MKEIKYALKLKKKGILLGYYTTPNHGDACDNQYILSETNSNIWYVDTKEHAEYVRNHSTEWYNAVYDTPTHDYKANELAIVKMEIITNMEEIEVKLPTYEEMAKFKSKGNKDDYGFYMLQKKNHPEITYSFYDMVEYFMVKGMENGK